MDPNFIRRLDFFTFPCTLWILRWPFWPLVWRGVSSFCWLGLSLLLWPVIISSVSCSSISEIVRASHWSTAWLKHRAFWECPIIQNNCIIFIALLVKMGFFSHDHLFFIFFKIMMLNRFVFSECQGQAEGSRTGLESAPLGTRGSWATLQTGSCNFKASIIYRLNINDHYRLIYISVVFEVLEIK